MRRTRVSTAWWRRLSALAIGALLGCEGDPELRRVDPTGFFTPSEVDFGVRQVGEAHALGARLRNTSARVLRVAALRFEPPSEVFLVRRADGGTLRGHQLGPGASVELEVLLRPPEAGVYDSTLVVVSDDFEVELPLRATAREVVPPRPIIEPDSLVFAGSEVGREVLRRVRVRNGGEVAAALTLARPARPPFGVTAPDGGPLALPSALIGPGEALELAIRYLPTAPGPASDAIPFGFVGGEQATLAVSGDARAAGTLACPAGVQLGQVPRGGRASARVDCVASGGPYTVAAIRPAVGTSPAFVLPAVLPAVGDGGSVAFEVAFEAAGLASTHAGALEVVAAHGAVTRVELAAEVVPPPPGATDLDLRLSWNTGYTDFDLHLVRAGGLPHTAGEDCHFADKNPDWGVAGEAADDPFLDRDDRDGFGPETISLAAAPGGTYDVLVQYFDHEGPEAPTSTVQLTYQLRGAGPVTLERDLSRCGDTWVVGRVVVAGSPPRFVVVDELSDRWRALAAPRCR